MKKPILVVLAAGMGSRFGGLKQLQPIDENGHVILDYSLFDARRAGFETVVFIIKKAIEAEFRAAVGSRIEPYMQVRYAFQEISDLPHDFTPPQNREKPWGTAHAIYAARDMIDAPFAVINADDYYGRDGFREIYDYLSTHPDTPTQYEYAMVGYALGNTVTENGTVARGVCEQTPDHFLSTITERTQIAKDGDDARFSLDGGQSWTGLPGDTVVSMNLWGFQPSFVQETIARFPAFLETILQENPQKGEYFLPFIVSCLLEEEKARVKVLRSFDKWHGVTYREDLQNVIDAMAQMQKNGMYPPQLWEDNQ